MSPVTPCPPVIGPGFTSSGVGVLMLKVCGFLWPTFSAGKTSRQSTQCRKQGAFQVEKKLKRDKNLKNLNNMFFLPLKRCLRKTLFIKHGPWPHGPWGSLRYVNFRLPKLGLDPGIHQVSEARRRGSWGLPVAPEVYFLCQGLSMQMHQMPSMIMDSSWIHLMAKVIQKVDRSYRKGWCQWCQSWLRQSWKPSSQTCRRTRRGAQWNQTQLRVESFHRKLRLALSKHEMSFC